MTISPELTKDYFASLYEDMLRKNAINILDKVLEGLDEMLKQFEEELKKITYNIKHATLLEIKMIEYVRINEPNMVLKYLNKILDLLNKNMELAEDMGDSMYLFLCDKSKRDYKRFECLKNTLIALQK